MSGEFSCLGVRLTVGDSRRILGSAARTTRDVRLVLVSCRCRVVTVLGGRMRPDVSIRKGGHGTVMQARRSA